jgi:hypothetical protein
VTASSQEIENQRMQIQIQQDNTEFAKVSSGSVPADYQQQADAWLADTLIDPDSRKVKFVSRPLRSLFCGTVNAKNRMGGYTGQAPFYGYFNESGKLVTMTIMDETVRAAIVNASPGTPFWKDHWMLDKCGLL